MENELVSVYFFVFKRGVILEILLSHLEPDERAMKSVEICGEGN